MTLLHIRTSHDGVAWMIWLLVAWSAVACAGRDADGSDLGSSDAGNVDVASLDADGSDVDTGGSKNGAPVIAAVDEQFLDEDVPWILPISVLPETGLRVWVEGLPPGALFDEPTRTIAFTPDFIQGGTAWIVTVHGANESGSVSASFRINVRDTTAPPAPQVHAMAVGLGYTRYEVAQTTDSYLDGETNAGRTFFGQVFVPDGASASHRMPVQVFLHGFDGVPYDGLGTDDQFRIFPHDPNNTYWWGFVDGDGLAGDEGMTAPNYTQRRVLHLLDWVLRTFPGADPDRVYLSGVSMGGAGAATLGLLYARHFAFVEAALGQMIPRHHRPDRIAQLEGVWGRVSDNWADGTSLENGHGMGLWDRQDICRVLRDVPEARDQFLYTKHSKDDSTIHFGSVTHASPIVGRSYYDTVQHERIGHYAVWDEGGHGQPDPVLGPFWWDAGFNLVSDTVSYLRRDRPFPAFSQATHDWDPGDGTGNGRQEWSDDSGFAGLVAITGDTGWSGDVAGALNRFLRWDTSSIVDDWERFELSLFVVDGSGGEAPVDGYPSCGDRFDRTLPVWVDVTPRRVSRFRCVPGEPVGWEFDGRSGTVIANGDGSVTVPSIPMVVDRRTLILTRVAEP